MDFKMNIIVVLISSILITSSVSGSGIDSLRAKLKSRFPNVGRSHGFGGAASSSAAAAANGGYGAPAYGSPAYGGSAAAAAAAAAAASGGARYAARPAYEDYPAELEDEFVEQPVLAAPPRFGGSSASAAAAASAATGVRPTAHYRAPAPVRPMVNLDSFRRQNVAYHKPAVRYVNQYPAVGGGAASAAAAASAASGGYGGSAASSAAAAAGSGGAGYVGEAAAATGTYANSDHGKESSAYRRSTENLLNHEDGHVDDNHYYNAQSYGKTDDENMHEAYNKDDEDVEQTAHVYRKKKSGENYVLDYNKARRESGSGVLAKDRHNSAFNKNSRKFIENVDQKHKIRGNGIVENINHVTAHNFDDDDEEHFDSDGLDAPVAPYGGSAVAASAAAAAAANGGSAASSASGAALH